MPGITQTEAFKNAERLEAAIVALGDLTEMHGIESQMGQALLRIATSLRLIMEATGLLRILQLGQVQSLQQELDRPKLLDEARAEATIAELMRRIETDE